MAWGQLFAAVAFPTASILLARACDEFYDVEDREQSFPLFKLPRELRLQVFERILADDPPSIGLDGRLEHPLMHDSLPPLSQDALNLLFHSVPILIDAGYSTGSSAYILKFFRYHDSKCGFAQRHRVRLQFPLPRTTTRCIHLRCILRALRCQSSFASPERTKASWGWIATGNGIPLENLETLPGEEPLIDFERISALCDVALLLFWLGVSTVSVFCFRILLPLYNVYVLPWKDRLDDLHAYTQQQKRSHGWLGFSKVHLQCATVVFSALLAVASFILHTYCDDQALREEVDIYVGVMCVTVGIVGYLVWKPNR